MKKLTVTATSANTHIEFAIMKVVPNVNGFSQHSSIMLTKERATAVRDELTRLLETSNGI